MNTTHENSLSLTLNFNAGQSYLVTEELSDEQQVELIPEIERLIASGGVAGCFECSSCRARLAGGHKVEELKVKSRPNEKRLSLHCGAHRDRHSNLEDMACSKGPVIDLNRSHVIDIVNSSQMETSPCKPQTY